MERAPVQPGWNHNQISRNTYTYIRSYVYWQSMFNARAEFESNESNAQPQVIRASCWMAVHVWMNSPEHPEVHPLQGRTARGDQGRLVLMYAQ